MNWMRERTAKDHRKHQSQQLPHHSQPNPLKMPRFTPVLALVLAAASVLLGAAGFSRLSEQSLHPISFVVEENLPYGITQETVEAAAGDRALSYQPFTMEVVSGELAPELQYGPQPEGSAVLLSVDVEFSFDEEHQAWKSDLRASHRVLVAHPDAEGYDHAAAGQSERASPIT